MILKSMIIGQLPIELTLILLSYFECNRVHRIMVLVYNITFYNMSVISWRTVVLVEQAPDIPQVTGILYHLQLYRVHLAIRGIRTCNFSVDIH